MSTMYPPLADRFNTDQRIPVGISSCLMGEPVRFNGGHKRSTFCTDTLSQYFDFISICPEVAIGMSTPREPIRLVSEDSKDQTVRAKGVVDNSIDVTDALAEYAKEQAVKQAHLCGYIFMQKSPSCGLFGVKRYLSNGYSEGSTRGIYADVFAKAHPLIPLEEAGRLTDAGLRENFMTRVYTYHDWHQFKDAGIDAQGLIEFHSRYKYLVMAHSTSHYKSMGHLLANLRDADIDVLAQEYFVQLMTAIAKPASRKMHTNTLMHLQGYLKKLISSKDKAGLSEIISQYHQGIVPLVVPLTMLKHHLSNHEEVSQYAFNQVYLNPHPYELGLRNTL